MSPTLVTDEELKRRSQAFAATLAAMIGCPRPDGSASTTSSEQTPVSDGQEAGQAAHQMPAPPAPPPATKGA